MRERVFAAVDLGASGGRVVAGSVGTEVVTLETIHHFPNAATRRDGHLRWDITSLFRDVLVGLRRLAHAHPGVESIGIDTWGVDYALLDASGELLGDPIAYRDDRTSPAIGAVHARVPPEELYATNGLQFLPFTTIYQLEAEKQQRRWDKAAHLVLLPDLLAYWLTGELATEVTNASTTGLVDVHTGQWSDELLERLEVPRHLLTPLQQPGTVRGTVRPDLCEVLGLRGDTEVTTVASHDTASAVVAVPATGRSFAYISSGTWSLVGIELDQPNVTSAAQTANFTNERGIDGRTRFLRNTGGLWLLQEALRSWAEGGRSIDLSELLDAAGSLTDTGPTIDPHDHALLSPGDMPSGIAAAAGDPSLATDPPRLARCVIDSLALAYARSIATACEVSDRRVDVVHIVGGGSLNAPLCQLTADRSALPVVAGPVEATAMGNIVVQARARGAAPATLSELRSLVGANTDLRTYLPQQSERAR